MWMRGLSIYTLPAFITTMQSLLTLERRFVTAEIWADNLLVHSWSVHCRLSSCSIRYLPESIIWNWHLSTLFNFMAGGVLSPRQLALIPQNKLFFIPSIFLRHIILSCSFHLVTSCLKRRLEQWSTECWQCDADRRQARVSYRLIDPYLSRFRVLR